MFRYFPLLADEDQQVNANDQRRVEAEERENEQEAEKKRLKQQCRRNKRRQRKKKYPELGQQRLFHLEPVNLSTEQQQ